MATASPEPNPFEPPAEFAVPVVRRPTPALVPMSGGRRALGAVLVLLTAGSAFFITAFYVSMLDWRPCGPAPIGLPWWAPLAAGGGAGLGVGHLVSWVWSRFGWFLLPTSSPEEVPRP